MKSEKLDNRQRVLMSAWEFLTSLSALVAIVVVSAVGAYRFDDPRNALAFSSIAAMAIVTVVVTTVVARDVGHRVGPEDKSLTKPGSD